MKQKRAYKYRWYPTDEQKQILARTFGCARFVYNWALRLRTDAYYERQERIGYHQTSAMLTDLKKQPEYAWLNEVSCVPPQQALRHLEKAFRNFFEGRASYPKFRSRHGDQSAEYTTSAFKWDGTYLTLARMDAPLDIHWSRTLPKGTSPTTVTVTKDIADRRRDYQHKLSTRIVHENQVICVESLTVKNMLGNHCLAKSISDVGWGEFVRKLEYKAQWYRRTLVKIDKWYPSSKRCSHCGHVLASLSLDERFWMCPECKTFHDRDINAAKNVLAAGLAVSACGEAVRPGRAKARSGRTQRSRKSNG